MMHSLIVVVFLPRQWWGFHTTSVQFHQRSPWANSQHSYKHTTNHSFTCTNSTAHSLCECVDKGAATATSFQKMDVGVGVCENSVWCWRFNVSQNNFQLLLLGFSLILFVEQFQTPFRLAIPKYCTGTRPKDASVEDGFYIVFFKDSFSLLIK